MEATVRLQGLCEVCAKKASCALCSGEGHQVMSGKCATIVECDQFEIRLGCKLPECVESPAGRAASDPDDPSLLGLCVNCANRETCTLHKEQGGIWHCEEYRC